MIDISSLRGGKSTIGKLLSKRFLRTWGKAILMIVFLAALGPNSVLKAQASDQSASIDTFVEKADKNGTALRMSLKDAMKIALQNNLNIAIQDYSEEIFRQRIFAAEHVYEPRFTGTLGYGSTDRPNTSFFQRAEIGNVSTTKSIRWSGGVVQNLPYGGNWKVEHTMDRLSYFPLTNFALFSSQIGGGLTFTFTQPLVRDFRNNQAFRAIKLAKLDEKMNDTKFEEQVTGIIKQVQDLYWELLFAIKDQEIKKKSLELAGIQLRDNRRKVEVGTLAPIAITEASAEVALREQAMIASENQINNMENQLKRALSNDRSSDLWNKSIIPTESAEFVPTNFDMQESIITAIKNRPELRRIQLGLEQTDVEYQYLKNQKKPKFDFVGSFGTVGVAGTPSPRFATIVPSDFRGGVSRLTRQLFSGDFKNYFAGIQFDIPIRSRGLEGQLAQFSLQRRQTLKQFKDAEQMVLVDVRNALQAIETNKRVVQTAQVGLKLSQEQLDGENKKFQAGLSTTFFVLQRQRDLAVAEGNLLRALVDYRKSINDLHKATFTTIDANDMSLAKSQVPPSER